MREEGWGLRDIQWVCDLRQVKCVARNVAAVRHGYGEIWVQASHLLFSRWCVRDEKVGYRLIELGPISRSRSSQRAADL